MDSTVISSTFLLTLLMMIGLIFFIRASVKDRTEQIELSTSESEDSILPKLQNYFDQRAYRVVDIDPLTTEVTFEGFVQPSVFMGIFLSLLSGLGLSCLVLVLFMLFPNMSQWFWLVLLLTPVAGRFYWKKAGRLEKVLLSIKPMKNDDQAQNVIRVTGHRDELIQLRQNISFQ